MVYLTSSFLNESFGFLPNSRMWQLSHFKIGSPYYVKLRRKREFVFIRKSRLAKKISAYNIQFFFLLRTFLWSMLYTLSDNVYWVLNNVLNNSITYLFGISYSIERSSNTGQFFTRYKLYSVSVDYRFSCLNFNILYFHKFKHAAFLTCKIKKIYWLEPRTLFRLHLKYDV